MFHHLITPLRPCLKSRPYKQSTQPSWPPHGLSVQLQGLWDAVRRNLLMCSWAVPASVLRSIEPPRSSLIDLKGSFLALSRSGHRSVHLSSELLRVSDPKRGYGHRILIAGRLSKQHALRHRLLPSMGVPLWYAFALHQGSHQSAGKVVKQNYLCLHAQGNCRETRPIPG
jgi:hypothetical protein